MRHVKLIAMTMIITMCAIYAYAEESGTVDEKKKVDAEEQQSASTYSADSREKIRTDRQLKEMQAEMDKRNRESMSEQMRQTPSQR